MLVRNRVVAALALSAAVLAAAPAAHAASYTVQAGEAARKGLPEAAIVNRYMPATVQVHVGDTVEFKGGVSAPHTATFLGGRPYTAFFFVGPDPARSVYEPVADAAGNTLPFAGKERWAYNLAAVVPAGGKVVGSTKKYVNSGFLPSGKKPGAKYVFPKAGTYVFTCLLHPGMVGKVVVKPKAAKVATPEAVARLAKKQAQESAAAAKALLTSKVPANTIVNGPAKRVAGGDVNLFVMKPAALTVKVGTTVSFRTDSNTEPHNVGTGPLDYLESYLKAQSLFPEGPTDPNNVPGDWIYNTENGDFASTGPFPYDGTNHGNGFLSLQATDSSPRTPLKQAQKITFTAPGTYTLYCLVHFPDMKSTITVEP